MGFLKEFKEFAMKGNVMDLAVGVIIGGAFGKIVTSMVSDVIMPIIGLFVGGINFTDWKIILKQATDTTPAVALNIGNFIQTSFDFIIVAFVIFMVIRGINTFRKSNEATVVPAAPAAALSKEEQLLTEIRDILKSNK